ncbi:zinc finger protein 628 [Trichonephila clavipes]|nr:zinc finger protein 628 [Trichonephila clavipes]
MKYLKQADDYVRKKQFTMAYSAEESSPVECFESCCICDEEFSSDSELTNHLLDHANEDEFISSLKKLEENIASGTTNSTLSKPVNAREQTLKRSFTQRSKSPELWEIVSDDSDDENNKNKVTKSSSNFRLVKPASSTPQASQNPSQQPPKPPQQLQKPSQQLQKPPQQLQKPPQRSLKPSQPPLSNQKSLQNSFTCPHCAMVFKDAKLYKEHLTTHEKARPYACRICNKSFAYKGTLRQHLHLHIGEKSHECKVCHKKFSLKRMLRQHEETHEAEQCQGMMITRSKA